MYRLLPGAVYLDPIGDRSLPPVLTRTPPRVTVSLHPAPVDTHAQQDTISYAVDRRKIRDFIGTVVFMLMWKNSPNIVLLESHRYTLLMVDAQPVSSERGTRYEPYVHWLVTDISANELRSGFVGMLAVSPTRARITHRTVAGHNIDHRTRLSAAHTRRTSHTSLCVCTARTAEWCNGRAHRRHVSVTFVHERIVSCGVSREVRIRTLARTHM
jgi:hypothetical protein